MYFKSFHTHYMNIVRIQYFLFTSGYQSCERAYYANNTFIFPYSSFASFLFYLSSLRLCTKVCELIFLFSSRSFHSYDIYNVYNKKNVCHIVTQCDSHQTKRNGQNNI